MIPTTAVCDLIGGFLQPLLGIVKVFWINSWLTSTK